MLGYSRCNNFQIIITVEFLASVLKKIFNDFCLFRWAVKCGHGHILFCPTLRISCICVKGIKFSQYVYEGYSENILKIYVGNSCRSIFFYIQEAWIYLGHSKFFGTICQKLSLYVVNSRKKLQKLLFYFGILNKFEHLDLCFQIRKQITSAEGWVSTTNKGHRLLIFVFKKTL